MSGFIENVKVGLKTTDRRFRRAFLRELLRRLKSESPVDTGKLKRSWRLELTDDDIAISNDAHYSAYVNSGTPKMSGRHFLESVLSQRAEIKAIAANTVADEDDERREARNERARARRKRAREELNG